MRKRDLRELRRAAREQDFSWMQERDEDEERDGLYPVDEHTSPDEFSALAQEFRG